MVLEELPRTETTACARHVCLWLLPQVLLELAGEHGDAFLRRLHRHVAPWQFGVDADALQIATRLGDGLLGATACPLLHDAWSLELLSRVLVAPARPARRARLTHGQRERLRRARELLLADFSNPPTLTGLAHTCGLSVFRLRQGFHSLYGQSIHALFQRERMQEAWRMIESGKMDVGTAGLHVGYSNLSHFSDAFRRRFGMLPSALKRCAQQVQVDPPASP